VADISEKQLKTLKKLVETAETNLAGARELLSSLVGDEQIELPASVPGEPLTGRVVEGAFDGQHMLGDDGKTYPVQANYASKSKLLPGDRLKLVIGEDGDLKFKQIGPVERRKLIGTLHLRDGVYYVEARGQEYRILYASVTYHKAQPGDQVSIVVPDGVDSEWAALEAPIG